MARQRRQYLPPVYNSARVREKPLPNTNQSDSESDAESNDGTFGATNENSNHEAERSIEPNQSKRNENNSNEQNDASELESTYYSEPGAINDTINESQQSESVFGFVANENGASQSNGNSSVESNHYLDVTSEDDATDATNQRITALLIADSHENSQNECDVSSDVSNETHQNRRDLVENDHDSSNELRDSEFVSSTETNANPNHNQSGNENEADDPLAISSTCVKDEGSLNLSDIDDQELENILNLNESSETEYIKLDDDIFISSEQVPQPFSHLCFWIKANDVLCGNIPFKEYVSVSLLSTFKIMCLQLFNGYLFFFQRPMETVLCWLKSIAQW